MRVFHDAVHPHHRRRRRRFFAAAVLAGEVPVWFGTYTKPKTAAAGIYVARFDTDTGALSRCRCCACVATNPSFLAFHPRLPMLYAVSEIATADGTPGGGLAAFAIDEATGATRDRAVPNRRGALGRAT